MPWCHWLLGLGLALGGVLVSATPAGAGVLNASWMAPTTNTDGTQLTDLGSYRVYYGLATVPCPGPSFVQVPSPTPSPGPGTTVSFRLTGLTAGTLYYVSVSAVDTAGNESACSLLASAVAQSEFAITPTGTLSFGSVTLGSFANQTFSVQNTRGGTVTGAVTAAAPFSIVSGSPFTLAGAGSSQTVTVRFSPTGVATTTGTVTFTAGGDSIARVVTGTGTNTVDTSPPTLGITSPTANPTFSTDSSLITLRGTSSDNVGVSQVTWVNSRGGSGTASGTTSWMAAIVLQPGANVLTVTARDPAGTTATRTLTATLNVFAFTDDPLVSRSTLVKAAHFVELRASINSVRAARGLTPFVWTDPTLVPRTTRVRGVHVTELRTALNQAYQAAGRTSPTYTESGTLVIIRAIHLTELRAAVRALQ